MPTDPQVFVPTRLRIEKDRVVHLTRTFSPTHHTPKVHPGYEVVPEEQLVTGGNVPSKLFGVVDLIDPKRGLAVIRTHATLIHGLVGSGPARSGHLMITKKVTQTCRGRILVWPGVLTPEIAFQALKQGAIGILCGGLHIKDNNQDLGITLVGTEGKLPSQIGEDIMDYLKPFDGHFAVLDGVHQQLILPTDSEQSMIYIRKTNLPVGTHPSSVTSSEAVLKIGNRVRSISGNLSSQGKVIAIDRTPTLLDSGDTVIMVTIETKHQKVRLPVTDLEILA